jgi:hypothetical protein
LRGEAAPYAHVVFGYRLELDHLRAGMDLTLRRFNRVRFESDFGDVYLGASGAFGVSLALGFKLPAL